MEARKEYKNSFVCASRIFKEEGIRTFWSGAVPRLARLIMSGGIVFTMCVYSLALGRNTFDFYRYEKTMEGLDRLDPERKYI